MERSQAGDTARPWEFALTVAVATGGFGTYIAVVELAGQDHAQDGCALTALVLVAVWAGHWAVTKVIGNRIERQYAEFILSREYAVAKPGADRDLVLARIQAVSNPIARAKILLMADGQIARIIPPAEEPYAEGLRELTDQVRRGRDIIVQAKTETEQLRLGVLRVAALLAQSFPGQRHAETVDVRAGLSRDARPGGDEPMPDNIVACAVAELRQLATLNHAA